MTAVVTIILAILAFCLMIIIHEMGHFFAAKACGMKVSEFSLGMGPRLFKKQGKETLYTIKLLPLGGSVQLGEDEESDDPRSFRNKPVWQRMIVLADDQRDIIDPAVDHAGKDKINHTITACKRNGSHRTLSDQIGDHAVVTVWENDPQCIYIRVDHCTSPPFTLLLTIAFGPIFALSPT